MIKYSKLYINSLNLHFFPDFIGTMAFRGRALTPDVTFKIKGLGIALGPSFEIKTSTEKKRHLLLSFLVKYGMRNWFKNFKSTFIHNVTYLPLRKAELGIFFCLFLLKMGVPNYDLRFAFCFFFCRNILSTTTGSRLSGWKKKFPANPNPDVFD